MKDVLRSWLLFVSGFLTVLLVYVLPDAGEEREVMIIIFTLPFLIGLGAVLALAYYFISKKIESLRPKTRVF